MHILAFNASPRKSNSTTDIILDSFLEAAKEAGATAKKHYVTELKINGCRGCFTCWTKTPGRCVQRDDMDWIIPEILDSDILIHATPIYNNNITHYLQRLKERQLPLALPWMVEQGETTRHPSRHQRGPQKTVLIAVAGFPDHQAFEMVKLLYPNSLHILLPSSQILYSPEGSRLIAGFTEAIPEAARQLVTQGSVDEDIKRRLVVEYSPEIRALIREGANASFESAMKKDQ